MGFFNRLKGNVGIDQPKLDFILDNNNIKRGDSIKGKIRLIGGKRELIIKEFTIEHIEVVTRRQWNDSQQKYVDQKVKNIVAKSVINMSNIELLRDHDIVREFELPVSTAAIVSGHPYAHKLKISADTLGLDPTKSLDIFIQ